MTPILLIEDDDVDAEIIQRTFTHLKLPNRLIWVKSADEALTLLRGELQTSSPLIVLDLNLPQMSGLQFLRNLRQDSQLRHTIVFILTEFDAAENIQVAYSEGIAGYILKDNTGHKFTALLQFLDAYQNIIAFP